MPINSQSTHPIDWSNGISTESSTLSNNIQDKISSNIIASPLQEIGKLESSEYPYTIFSPQNKELMRKELSLAQEREADKTYIENILWAGIILLSLRDKWGKPCWIIYYNPTKKSLEHFWWKNGSETNDKKLVLETLDRLIHTDYLVNSVSNELFDFSGQTIFDNEPKEQLFSFSILRNISNQKHEASRISRKDFKEKCLSGRYHVVRGSIELNQDDSEEDILKLCQLWFVSLDLTWVWQEIKNNITHIVWNIKNFKRSASYKNLVNIEGNGNFMYLDSAEWFEKLENIGGDAYFSCIPSGKGLENLRNIGGDADFHNVRSAEWFEKLENIGGYAHFPMLPESERQKIPALVKKKMQK